MVTDVVIGDGLIDTIDAIDVVATDIGGTGVTVTVLEIDVMVTGFVWVVVAGVLVTTVTTTSDTTVVAAVVDAVFIIERRICAGKNVSGCAGAGNAPPFFARFFRKPISC